MAQVPHSITRLLSRADDGDSDAAAELIGVVYPKLRKIAARQMRRERPGHTLQTTALVNEAYLELFASGEQSWESRAHSFAYAASVMRHILVRHARAKKARKRGGDLLRVTLPDVSGESRNSEDLIALDAVLSELSGMDERKGRIVELRFFGGLSIKEIAAVLGVSTSLVNKELRAARGWLFHQLQQD